MCYTFASSNFYIMKKHFYVMLNCLLLTISLRAQNVGIGTTTPKAGFNVAEEKTVLFGKNISGQGSKMMWIPELSAFRAGAIGNVSTSQYTSQGDSTIWNMDSIGLFSFAGGYQNISKGIGSTAFGAHNASRGWFTNTLGYENVAIGELSTAIGHDNYCTGNTCFAFGVNNVVESTLGIALGSNNVLSGDFYMFASGNLNSCLAFCAQAHGYKNTVSGLYGAAIGANHIVQSSYGVSLGNNSINNSSYCTIVGAANVAQPEWSASTWKLSDPIFIVGNGHTDQMRSNALVVLKNGKTGIGTDSPVGMLHITGNSSIGIPQLYLQENGTDYARITFKNSNPGFWDVACYTQPFLGNNQSALFSFYYSNFGANIFSLRGNGNAVLAGTLTQSSDERLKKNIEPLSHVLEKVLKISGYSYVWKDSLRGYDTQIGFIAQELEQQFPELVATDEAGMKSVAYSNMVPVLLEAIKEQQKQIDELKVRLSDK